MKHRRPTTIIDLFCGAGGLSAGFERAGFKVLAGSDSNRYAAETFRTAHPDAAFLEAPIEKLSASDFLRAAKIRPGQLDCLAGGPPCQAFSINNHQRGLHDKRSRLFRSYISIVEGLRPKWVVLENVTGIYSAGDGKVVAEITSSLKDLGYHIEFRTLKAEEYGVPQERRRVIFIGNRMGLPIRWPEPTHGPSLRPFVTVGDAINDLPQVKNGQGSDIWSYRGSPRSEYQSLLRQGADVLFNHVAPKLAEINLRRMAHIPQGGNWRDIPRHLLPSGMKRARKSDHTKRYGRLHPNDLASTILTKCDLHWGAFIHPSQQRSLTVREAARLQSFADTFKFCGPKSEQFVQVGNAVPPLLAEAIARSLVSEVTKSDLPMTIQRRQVEDRHQDLSILRQSCP